MDSKLIESTCSYTLIKLSQKLPKYLVIIQDNQSISTLLCCNSV